YLKYQPRVVKLIVFPLYSLESSCSSRTFRYGYLVTTSPQSSVPPSAAGSIKVTSPTSGVTNSRGVTGGVYKTRVRIHRGVLIHDYYRFRLHAGELQPAIRTENGFKRFACPRGFATRCTIHCSTCVAQVIRGMLI